MRRPDLAERSLNYDSPGATRPAEPEWRAGMARRRAYERSIRIGQGDNHWEAATSALLRWGIKTRSGFVVEPSPAGPVAVDDRYWLVARFGPVSVREPVQVVAVVDEPDRRGFAYGTLDGHPVSGEEAFVLHRTTDGGVWLTLRSLTSAPRGRWRLAFPVVLVGQRWYRRRYLRALLDPVRIRRMAEHEPHDREGRRPPVTAADWDELYGELPLWSGNPNGSLVREASSLQPGRALDVGCGEGADAVWLARRGWDVVGLDVSSVALARAEAHAREADVEVTWLHAGLTAATLPSRSFDLVSAHYPALPATPDHDAERALLEAVAPGGTLLFVHHDIDPAHHGDGFDPDAYVLPPQVTAILDDAWDIEVDEKRPRDVPEGGGGAHHTVDVVLRVRRMQ